MIVPIAFFSGTAFIIGCFLIGWRATYLSATAYFFMIVTLVAIGLTALGRPVPLWAARPFLPERIQLAGYILHEGVSIDLLVSNPEMLVSMPWDEKRAAQLYQADQQARAGQTALMMDLDALAGKPGHGRAGQGKPGKGNPAGAQGTKDNEPPIFYPAPVAALPDKQGD